MNQQFGYTLTVSGSSGRRVVRMPVVIAVTELNRASPTASVIFDPAKQFAQLGYGPGSAATRHGSRARLVALSESTSAVLNTRAVNRRILGHSRIQPDATLHNVPPGPIFGCGHVVFPPMEVRVALDLLNDALGTDHPDAQAFTQRVQRNILKGHARAHTAQIFTTFNSDIRAARKWIARGLSQRRCPPTRRSTRSVLEGKGDPRCR